jgi:glycosyltransferase involved in cell wall biosynthesis
MKILLVSHNRPSTRSGGVEILVYNVAVCLAKRHEVHIFYRSRNRNEEKRVSLGENIYCHEFASADTLFSKLKIIAKGELLDLSMSEKSAEREFKRLVEKIRPNVTHFFHLKGLSMALPLIAKKYGPVILNLCDYWLLCPTTHFLDCRGLICHKWSDADCANCLPSAFLDIFYSNFKMFSWIRQTGILEFCSRLYEKRIKGVVSRRKELLAALIRKSDIVISISQTIVNTFVERSFIADKDIENQKVSVITPGIDVGGLEGCTRNRSDKIRFGFVGSFCQRKGLHVLVDAFKILNSDKAELLIYGRPVPYEKKYFDGIYESSRNNPSVKFMGSFVNRQEPYLNIDVLVVPSVTYEGFGLVVQEAFAAKIPVVASDIGALNESVRHKCNGLLFKVADRYDLSRALLSLVDNPGLLSKLKEGIGKVYSIEEYSESLEELYRKVAGT